MAMDIVRTNLKAGDSLTINAADGYRAYYLLSGKVEGLKKSKPIKLGTEESVTLTASEDSIVGTFKEV